MSYHSAIAIANEFLLRAARDERRLTHMHLQKLVYLAHGWTLAVTGRPLIEEPFEAWDYGPVVRNLYKALRRFGAGPVLEMIQPVDESTDGDTMTHQLAILDTEETEVIDRVWKIYGGFEAFQLSALTHEQGSPWAETYDAESRIGNQFISNDKIWDYFAVLADRHHG